MKVFKFGGASIKDAESIKNVANIIQSFQEEDLAIVISASGKTTNALEEVVAAYYDNTGNAKELLEEIKNKHFVICNNLFDKADHPVYDLLENLVIDVVWTIEEDRKESYNYVYDQIVSLGEMMSTTIVSNYLNSIGVVNTWLDIRDILKTDDTYREAVIDWPWTEKLTKEKVGSLLKKGKVITQGFIGCTSDNVTTTLGREGSDYTAAVIANIMDAENQTIWKDVPGVLSGDPRIFDDAVLLEKLTYHEAVEMTYYGASVIHPKTIKPLQNKRIPLLVKSFIHPSGKGSIIQFNESEFNYPPVRVVKKDQALINLYTKDFSFIEEYVMSKIIRAFSKVNLKINMMQHAAILFQACVNNESDKIEKVVADLENYFKIDLKKDLTLLTIRHYDDETIIKEKAKKKAILEQKRSTTYQVLLDKE